MSPSNGQKLLLRGSRPTSTATCLAPAICLLSVSLSVWPGAGRDSLQFSLTKAKSDLKSRSLGSELGTLSGFQERGG